MILFYLFFHGPVLFSVLKFLSINYSAVISVLMPQGVTGLNLVF